MEYRPLAEADLDRWRRLEAYAFQSNPDRSQIGPEKLAQLRGLFVDGEQVCQLELVPQQLETGRGPIGAVGIGSVASAPETRRRGHVEALLRHTVAELRASGASLSLLYPFKRAFYSRYGWATFMERRVYQGPPAAFAGFRHGPGRFTPAGPEQIAELDSIYRGALRGRFGPTVRDTAWWRDQVLKDWDAKPYEAVIWRDEAGAPRSYLIYRLVRVAEGRRLQCQDIVALDPTARAQLFAFFADHDAQVESVRFKAPADAPVNLLLPEPLECSIEPHFMLRLLDVPAALAGYHYPRELAGRLTISVGDDWIAENNAVFSLELAGGRADVQALPAGSPADVSCDVRVLAQIYSRYLRPRSAAAFGLLGSASPAALGLLDNAFAGLAPFNADFF
jgi:predicted acetyltransferase